MKVMDVRLSDKEDVRHMSEVQLTRMGVRLFEGKETMLQCIACGEIWELQLDSSGKLPFGYWLCPARCNA
jgi:hypothetical protein